MIFTWVGWCCWVTSLTLRWPIQSPSLWHSFLSHQFDQSTKASLLLCPFHSLSAPFSSLGGFQIGPWGWLKTSASGQKGQLDLPHMKRLSTVSESVFAFRYCFLLTLTFPLERFQFNTMLLWFPLTSLVVVGAVVRSKTNFYFFFTQIKNTSIHGILCCLPHCNLIRVTCYFTGTWKYLFVY